MPMSKKPSQHEGVIGGIDIKLTFGSSGDDCNLACLRFDIIDGEPVEECELQAETTVRARRLLVLWGRELGCAAARGSLSVDHFCRTGS